MNSITREQTNLIKSTGTVKTVKDEEFIVKTYNDLEIIYRKKDMYFNAYKMCVSQGKNINQLFNLEYWKEQVKPIYLQYLKQKSSSEISTVIQECNKSNIRIEDEGLRYYLDESYQEFQGWYIHPILINRIAQWFSIEYSFKVECYMNSINEELLVLNKSFKQKQQERLDKIRHSREKTNNETQSHINKNPRNKLDFKTYCSNTFNIPIYQHNTEALQLPSDIQRMDLFDYDKKITGLCKHVIRELNNIHLNRYFKCVDYINQNYEGWTHKLFISTATNIQKTLIPEIEKRNIEVIKVDFENEPIKTEKTQLELNKEEMKSIKEVVDTAISTIAKQNDETVYISNSDFVQLCKQKGIHHNKASMELRSRGFEFKPSMFNISKIWVKKSTNTESTYATMKDDLLKLVEHDKMYDRIKTSNLNKYCKSKSITMKDEQLLASLNELGFKSQLKTHFGWEKLNPILEQQLNNFLQNDIQQFIHKSERDNYEYISLHEIKKYCSSQPDKPFDRDLILDYIRNVLQFNKHEQYRTEENRVSMVWTKPLN